MKPQIRYCTTSDGVNIGYRGEFAMKGFDDAVRLYEVRWRE